MTACRPPPATVMSLQVIGKGDEPPKDSEGNVLQAEAAGTHVDISGQLLILAVGNGRQAGGGVQLCSKAGGASQVQSLTGWVRPVLL